MCYRVFFEHKLLTLTVFVQTSSLKMKGSNCSLNLASRFPANASAIKRPLWLWTFRLCSALFFLKLTVTASFRYLSVRAPVKKWFSWPLFITMAPNGFTSALISSSWSLVRESSAITMHKSPKEPSHQLKLTTVRGCRPSTTKSTIKPSSTPAWIYVVFMNKSKQRMSVTTKNNAKKFATTLDSKISECPGKHKW